MARMNGFNQSERARQNEIQLYKAFRSSKPLSWNSQWNTSTWHSTLATLCPTSFAIKANSSGRRCGRRCSSVWRQLACVNNSTSKPIASDRVNFPNFSIASISRESQSNGATHTHKKKKKKKKKKLQHSQIDVSDCEGRVCHAGDGISVYHFTVRMHGKCPCPTQPSTPTNPPSWVCQ